MDKHYYISQGQTPEAHLENIKNVCASGTSKLVQLRLKGCTDRQYLETAVAAKAICDTYGATLIINDNIDVALKANADGVHLGQHDSTPQEAKNSLPEGKIIGGTANTIDDCLRLIEAGIDYIGLGPYRFTTTKQKLSPILGIEGYTNIISALKAKGYHTPIYAIGGITAADIQAILDTGVHGVAVSSIWSNTTISALKQTQDGSITYSR